MSRLRNMLSHFTLNAIILLFLIIYLIFACKKFEAERIIKVETGSVTNVSYTSCSVQGTILDKGKNGIVQHGFCWSITQNPTTENNSKQFGSKSSTGNFSGNLTGLSANTTYYVRAYAQSKDGISYGDQKSFKTLALSSPTVTTTSVSNITENSAQSGGNVTDDGGTTVTNRGVCWSASQNPTISDSHTTDGNSTGSYISSLTGLLSSTTHYVKAYATNSVGTAYGTQKSFITSGPKILPLVTTTVSNITDNSADCGGNVTSDGGTTVTERGVYWSTSEKPLSTGTKLTIGNGTGTYFQTVSELSANTIYYLQAYATNSVGTAYGNEINFKTWAGSVNDIDGNIYETVKIGDQLWMAENLKTTHYTTGDEILLITDNTMWSYTNCTTDAYCNYNNDVNNVDTYGRLYNYYTINDSRNLCPSGWHVPNGDEWLVLIDYLGGDNVAGGKMKEIGTTHWSSPNTGATNESGFSCLPGGYRYDITGAFGGIGVDGYWWSSSLLDGNSNYLNLNYNSAQIYKSIATDYFGFSVRCIKNN